MRSESEVFSELTTLCRSEGYIHALAFISAFNQYVIGSKPYRDTEPDTENPPELTNSEIMVLVGLLFKGPITYDLPPPEVVYGYVTRIYELLDEIHQVGNAQSLNDFELNAPFPTPGMYQKDIFYAGDSAHYFQYCELALKKYEADADWLLKNKNIDLKIGSEICTAIRHLHEKRMKETVFTQMDISAVLQTSLSVFSYSVEDLGFIDTTSKERASSFIEAFTLPSGQKNPGFTSLSTFNIAYKYPIIRKSNTEFIVLSYYSLSQAFYENLFFWMQEDTNYVNLANQNRGNAAESITADLLTRVFSRERVFNNVEIVETKGNRTRGEIDVLVVYGRYVIVAQVKSKRLTMKARRGNLDAIQDDFEKAIHRAARQAMSCGQYVGNPNVKLKSKDGRKIPEIDQSAHVLPMTVVLDPYPGLFFQTQSLLQDQSTERISSPFVTDVFALDTVAEILDSPARFLHYLLQRGSRSQRRHTNQEYELLSLHLKHGLEFGEDITDVFVESDLAGDIDLLMCIRRDGAEGPVPSISVLDQYANTYFGSILRVLEQNGDPSAVDLALVLLEISHSSQAIEGVNRKIEKCVDLVKSGSDHRFCSLGLSELSTGITFMCVSKFDEHSTNILMAICKLRKYQKKLSRWFGIMLSLSGNLESIYEINRPWEEDEELESISKDPRCP